MRQIWVLILLCADPGACGQNINPICPASIGENITMICEYDLEKCKKNCQTNQACRLDWCKKNPQHCWNPENLKQPSRSTSGISIQESAQKGQFNLTITQIKDKDFGLYSCKLCNKDLTRIRLKNHPAAISFRSNAMCRTDDEIKLEDEGDGSIGSDDNDQSINVEEDKDYFHGEQ
ncbi:uncharacterized protein O3C94_015176 isoform 1-T2 [Discoglossus pictus]